MNLPYAESADQNKDVILDVLKHVFAASKKVMEIGSGTGQHAVHFAEHMPHLRWLPTEQAGQLQGIDLWRAQSGLMNVEAAKVLDAGGEEWPSDLVQGVDGMFTANTFHIMSWPQVSRCLQGIAASLPAGGRFVVYGPFNYDGQFTSQSNARFDLWLKQRDSLSGVRDFEAIVERAGADGMSLLDDVEMPVNNRILVFVKD